ncbi:hydroxyacylglutathione hydrolase [Ideonella sp. A 288]|uniref:hydroxyacylglutathione hydrolase n=1 Tax=Ideonella sp. A 288 TaxID=1962181 RepID=UPI000B4BBE30|nr:hydroxyacylglutathione hydrolase [Ideonella sp. A 288]
MNLIALPAFTDNYIWMLHDGHRAIVVDPGDAQPVQAALESRGLELAGILVTHHHPDHVGGVDALRSSLHGEVFGPVREDIPTPFRALHHGDTVQVAGLAFDVIDVPGHTAGHIAFVHRPPQGQAPILFCGDTLFSAGCGRLFEGTAAQMHASLSSLAALPPDTQVCCAHEYTESNLRFAAAVEPDNAAIADHIQVCRSLRADGRSTLPSTIGRELEINPFLRCAIPAVQAAARQRGAADDSGPAVLGALREWKNTYR